MTTTPTFADTTLSSVATCPRMRSEMDKATRHSIRLNLIERGKNSNDPKVQEAAARLERDNKAVERAKLADHVYATDKNPVPPPPEGWEQMSEEEMKEIGLEPKDLVDPETGYKAAIYKSNFENPPSTVISFAGTDDMSDVGVDIAQGVGAETKHYNQAVELANYLAMVKGPANVELTGHSLGGGLASASSTVTGCKATTFNAAGLTPATVERMGIDKKALEQSVANTDAFYSSNDPLNVAQDSLPGLSTAHGNRIEVEPAPANQLTWKKKILSPVDSALTGHGSSKIVENIEHEKNQDANTILNSK